VSGRHRPRSRWRAATLAAWLASACATADAPQHEVPEPDAPAAAPAAVEPVAEPANASPLVPLLERRSLWFGSGVVLVQEDLTLVQAWRLRTLAGLEGVGQVVVWRPPAGGPDLVAAGLDPASAAAALDGRTAASRPALAAFDGQGRLGARFEIDWPESEQPGLLAVCVSRHTQDGVAGAPAAGTDLARAIDWVRKASAPGADDRSSYAALRDFTENVRRCPTTFGAIARLAAEPGVSRIALAAIGHWDSASMTALGVPPWVSMDMIATHGWAAESLRDLVWVWGPRWRRLAVLAAERSDAWPADGPSVLVRVD
jgi:hypothetical protein